MNTNAFFDIDWIRTVAGSVTPEEALLRCHEPEFALDLSLPAYDVSSQFRFLLSLTALAVRKEFSGVPTREEAAELSCSGFSKRIIRELGEDLREVMDLCDPNRPFMARPLLKPTSVKDTSRRIGPGDQPVKKLLPAMPAEQGEDYWNLLVEFPNSLNLSDATLKIVTYHYFSMAGNNKYDNDKARMGAPGIRFPGKGYAATEHIWFREGSGLLLSLLTSLPKTWVEGHGLPAWADRTGEKSRISAGVFHPLWVATWSSNTVAEYWEDTLLTGVRVGGVPTSWWPDIPAIKDEEHLLKDWWDSRNIEDPLYFYLKNKDGEPKAQRIDFGRDGTDLAVEWAAHEKTLTLKRQTQKNILPIDNYPEIGDDDGSGLEKYSPVFFRHQVEGTASSPSIRASEVFFADPLVWGFDLTPEKQLMLRDNAEKLREIHRMLMSIFRRKNSSDTKREHTTGWGVLALDSLESSRSDASDEYWRRMTDAYAEYLTSLRVGEEGAEDLYRGIRQAALGAYDTVTAPHLAQYANEILYVRASFLRFVNSRINDLRGEGLGEIKEESDE